MVAYGWPELFTVPINKATGLLRVEQIQRNLGGLAARGSLAVRLLRGSKSKTQFRSFNVAETLPISRRLFMSIERQVPGTPLRRLNGTAWW